MIPEDLKFKDFLSSHKFGRKFLAIYKFSQTSNVIYSDDDILLFRQPKDLINLCNDASINFAYSPDTSGCQCPFHEEMIKSAKVINTDPIWDFQAGLIYIKKLSLTRDIIDLYLAPWTIENDMYFSEQTLFALVLSHIERGIKLSSQGYIQNGAKGRFFWENDMDYNDSSIILRHFVGTVRHRYFEVAKTLIKTFSKNDTQA